MEVRTLLAVLLVAAAACQAASQPTNNAGTTCAWTNSHEIPPNEVLAFIRGGMNPPATLDEVRETARTKSNWIGNGGVWISLPADGRVTWGSPTSGSKFWVYSFAGGPASAEAQRIDITTQARFRTSIGDQGSTMPEGPGFLPSDLVFPEDGCWRVSYHVGASQVEFTVVVDRNVP